MVFPGKVSGGCLRCKQRKVKCDEGKPACQKCIQYGEPCPGYATLVVRMDKRNTEKQKQAVAEPSQPMPKPKKGFRFKTQKIREPKNKAPPSSSSAQQQEPSSTQVVRAPSPLDITPEPCWEVEALALFSNQHVLPIQARATHLPGHLDFLTTLYETSPADSCMRQALESTSYLSLYHCSKSSTVKLKAQQAHVDAIKSLSSALQPTSSASSKEILASVMLLSMYEDLHGDRTTVSNPHMMGMRTLIKQTYPSAMSIAMDPSLFGWAFTQIMVDTSMTGTYDCLIPPELKGYDGDSEPLRAMVITTELGEFISLSKETIQKASSLRQKGQLEAARDVLLSAIRKFMELQGRLISWNSSISADWKGHLVTSSFNPNAKLRIYATRWLACFWALVQTSMLYFYAGVVSCCRQVLSIEAVIATVQPSMLSTTINYGIDNIKQLATEVCDSVPFAFGDVDNDGKIIRFPHPQAACAYLLVWPLTVISRCSLATDEQRALCCATLERSSQAGIGVARSVLRGTRPAGRGFSQDETDGLINEE